MADPFIGEIRTFAFTYAPMGWATCNGQILQIQQNTALFSILGATYGGNGSTTFGLPNLQGRAPMDFGAGPGLTPRTWGQSVGDASVSLVANNFPPHTHGMNAVTNSNASLTAAANSYLSKPQTTDRPPVPTNVYQPSPSGSIQLAADAVQSAGTASGAISHDNMQPYLPMLFCIALNGIFPPRQ